MSHYSKDVSINDEAVYLWDIFWKICKRKKTDDYGPILMSVRELFEELYLTGDLINRQEANILLEMDASYCKALREEIRTNTLRAKEKSGK